MLSREELNEIGIGTGKINGKLIKRLNIREYLTKEAVEKLQLNSREILDLVYALYRITGRERLTTEPAYDILEEYLQPDQIENLGINTKDVKTFFERLNKKDEYRHEDEFLELQDKLQLDDASLIKNTKLRIFSILGVEKNELEKSKELANGITPAMRKYSKITTLIDMINTINEITDSDKLLEILEEVQKIDKEGKLDNIKKVNIEEEIMEDYAREYNATATRYDKLSDKEISQIEGVETLEANGRKIIILNGAPFRFSGRTINANTVDERLYTSLDYVNERWEKSKGTTNFSLISNIRMNRWHSDSAPFDIFNSIDKEAFDSFGAADARHEVQKFVSPELLQRCVDSRSAAGYHTHCTAKGGVSASTCIVPMNCINEDIPYDTIYVLNDEPYIEQNKMYRNSNSISSTNPEDLLDMLNSSLGRSENGSILNQGNNKEALANFMENSNFEESVNSQDLRYIKSVLNTGKDLNDIRFVSIDKYERELDNRLEQLANGKEFSISEYLAKINNELDREVNDKDIMLDFIQNEIKKAKEKGSFVIGDSKPIKQTIAQKNLQEHATIPNDLGAVAFSGEDRITGMELQEGKIILDKMLDKNKSQIQSK